MGTVLPGHQSQAVSCIPLLFSSRDDIIGKVCITRDMLAEHPKGKERVAGGSREGLISHPLDKLVLRGSSMTPSWGSPFSHRIQWLDEPQRGGP